MSFKLELYIQSLMFDSLFQTLIYFSSKTELCFFYYYLLVCFLDSGQSSHGASAKGERLSMKLKTLPGSNEPYEASAQKDIGEQQRF